MCYRTKQSIMITRINCSWIVIHIVFWTFSNCLRNPNLVLSMMKHMSLLSLKKSVTSGSLKLTRMGKFKLAGSGIICHILKLLLQISSKFRLFLVKLHKVVIAINILSLSTVIPWLVIKLLLVFFFLVLICSGRLSLFL